MVVKSSSSSPKKPSELTTQLRKPTTIDWTQRESVRATIRLGIKKLLKKYKYPPDKQGEAISLVLKQAEVLSHNWTNEVF